VNGRLHVLSGPSGVGKGTLVRALRARRPDLEVSVSATTRARRPGEVDGVDYLFLDDEQFDELVATDGFLEWAAYAGNRYGTPEAPVRKALESGADVVLEIEVQGARQVREREPAAILILVVPPSFEVLAARLATRGTETPDIAAARLAVARQELAEADLFDHLVVNDRVEDAVTELERILDGSIPARARS
jgi:guanylate kinase